jgi:hypothetical protein
MPLHMSEGGITAYDRTWSVHMPAPDSAPTIGVARISRGAVLEGRAATFFFIIAFGVFRPFLAQGKYAVGLWRRFSGRRLARGVTKSLQIRVANPAVRYRQTLPALNLSIRVLVI